MDTRMSHIARHRWRVGLVNSLGQADSAHPSGGLVPLLHTIASGCVLKSPTS